MAESIARPFSIKIFLPAGDPDGLRLIERSLWTGVGVVFNRSDYKTVASRPEFLRTGVYVLIGPSEDSSLPTIYVGEGDPVKPRLDSHHSNKDFWTWAIEGKVTGIVGYIGGKHRNLTVTHALVELDKRYIEVENGKLSDDEKAILSSDDGREFLKIHLSKTCRPDVDTFHS